MHAFRLPDGLAQNLHSDKQLSNTEMHAFQLPVDLEQNLYSDKQITQQCTLSSC